MPRLCLVLVRGVPRGRRPGFVEYFDIPQICNWAYQVFCCFRPEMKIKENGNVLSQRYENTCLKVFREKL